MGSLMRDAEPFVARSPFAALSGKIDALESGSELVKSVREGIFIDQAAMPIIPIGQTAQTAPQDHTNLNAYIYDYFRHGQKKIIVRDNGVLEGDAWDAMKGFCVVLQGIVDGLQICGKSSDDEAIAHCFKTLSDEFREVFSKYNA